MLRLIDDRPLAAKLGQYGREQMLEHFTIQRTIDEVDTLYRESSPPSEDWQGTWSTSLSSRR